MIKYQIPNLPLIIDVETKAVLKQLARSNRALAELKGVAGTIPNENILISSLTLQEAKDSSSVENIITTQDDLYRADLAIKDFTVSPAAKEVQNYREAIFHGFQLVRQHKLLTNNNIISIQNVLKHTKGGFRVTPGTCLKRDDGMIIYEPPQHPEDIVRYMGNLEAFINTPDLSDLDPLVKMAIIHHQFESIHPFYDGNGRTGRIVNILYLVTSGLLDLPILYLSRYITHNKAEYYERIQAIRNATGDNSAQWEAWILYMLRGVEQTAEETIALVKNIGKLMTEYKNIIRPAFGGKYSHELLNGLFYHPYTKIGHLESNMQVSRQTAAKYLDRLASLGLLQKERMGKENYYINTKLMELFLTFSEQQEADNTDGVESVHVEKSPNP